MHPGFPNIEWQEKFRSALIIDDEVDFCVLMKYYLTRKNCEVIIADTFERGIEAIYMERPMVIIVGFILNTTSKEDLQNVIDSITDYSPRLFLLDPNKPEEENEGAVMYTLKKKKENSSDSTADYLKRIFDYIKKLFK